jgi:hypothetical protein
VEAEGGRNQTKQGNFWSSVPTRKDNLAQLHGPENILERRRFDDSLEPAGDVRDLAPVALVEHLVEKRRGGEKRKKEKKERKM